MVHQHMRWLGLAHTEDFSTVLPHCQQIQERMQWPHGAMLQQQLWGNMADLVKTTTFIQI